MSRFFGMVGDSKSVVRSGGASMLGGSRGDIQGALTQGFAVPG
jgi:hypothetical protein